jgi:hypothetical protein
MTNVSRTEQSESMISIYDGRQCVGFVLARGRRGYEAFNAGERSIGIFTSRDTAIGECVKQAGTNKK